MAQVTPREKTTRDGQAFLIRTAEPADATPLLSYIRQVAQETPFFVLEADELALTEDQERRWIQDHFDRPAWLVLLAELSGQLVGSLSFENGPHRRIAHRGVFGVSVAKPFRGRGIGTALIDTFLRWAAETPFITKIGLETFANNENAIRLYKHLGFVEEGVKKRDVRFDNGRYCDVVVMGRFV